MGKATHTFTLPRSVEQAALRLAAEDGVSLEHWVAATVAQKVGAVQTAAAFFRDRGNRHASLDLLALLDRVPDGPIDIGDEVVDG